MLCAPLVHGLGAVDGPGSRRVGRGQRRGPGGGGRAVPARPAPRAGRRPGRRAGGAASRARAAARAARPWAATCSPAASPSRPASCPRPRSPPGSAPPTVAAHQVVLQLWFFMALVLDAVAIAAQSLVGAALGGGDVPRARALARQVGGYGLVLGTGVRRAVRRAGRGAAAACSPPTRPCWRRCRPPGGSSPGCSRWRGWSSPWTGSCSARATPRYLRTWTLVAAAAGFLPLIWASLAFGWGLVGIWTGLLLFVVLRLVAVLLRVRSGRLGGGGGGPRPDGRLGEDAGMTDRDRTPTWPRPASWSSTSLPGSPRTTSWRGCGGSCAPARSATPARSTRWPPACSSAGSAAVPSCSVTWRSTPRPTPPRSGSAPRRPRTTPRARPSPTADPSAVTDEAIAAGIAALTGPILQVPSSVSAIKIDGRRAYARVRAGEQVVLPAAAGDRLGVHAARPARRRPGRRRRVLVRDLRAGAGP